MLSLEQIETRNEDYEIKLGKLPTLTGKQTHYCAGCEHGTLTRLVS